ncbi:MAG: flagellar motor switch protein FliM, partial [Gammaproteobacteria bacterium]|nr:flagellar motor switch protein FliM [Gammaproteobacteria bacterium]
MAEDDALSQDEVDALLNGVDNGEVETESEEAPAKDAEPFDFLARERIVRGRMPTLEMINSRFARYFKTGMFNLLNRVAEISMEDIEQSRFSDYVNAVPAPASINIVKIPPLKGSALFVFDAKLVFTIVDNFFGGDGRVPEAMEEREFTTAESRLVQKILQRVFTDMQEAWSNVCKLNFEYVMTETNPSFANIVTPSELVVVSRVYIELDGGGGELHIVMPYSMLEPIRELLEAGMQSDRADGG